MNKKTGPLQAYMTSEKDKINTLPGWKKKIEYIFQYYWLWILGIVCGVAILGYIIFHALFAIKENWFFAMYPNTWADVGNESEFWQGYVDYTGYDTKEKNVEFNNSFYFDLKKNSGTGNSYYQSFVAFIEAGTLDVVTMEKDQLIAVGETGRLLDLSVEGVRSIYEKYQDRLVYATPIDESYSTEPVPIGIDISDSILMTKYEIYEDSCVLGIGSYTQHLDAIEKFLEYIYME